VFDMDQWQEAIRLTKSKISHLESELRREREFLSRSIPDVKVFTQARANKTRHWHDVLRQMSETPLKFEHICDFAEKKDWALTRGGVRAGLTYQVKRGYVERTNEGFYKLTKGGETLVGL
jgi:hypothetical protein